MSYGHFIYHSLKAVGASNCWGVFFCPVLCLPGSPGLLNCVQIRLCSRLQPQLGPRTNLDYLPVMACGIVHSFRVNNCSTASFREKKNA